LKLLETSRIGAEALTATDLAHGPVAALDPLFPVWTIASHDETLPAVLEAAGRIKAAGGMLIASGSAAALLPEADYLLAAAPPPPPRPPRRSRCSPPSSPPSRASCSPPRSREPRASIPTGRRSSAKSPSRARTWRNPWFPHEPPPCTRNRGAAVGGAGDAL